MITSVATPVFKAHLGEAPVVLGHHGRVGAVQLLDDLEALVELREDVHNRAGEQSVLRRLLELKQEGHTTHETFTAFSAHSTHSTLSNPRERIYRNQLFAEIVSPTTVYTGSIQRLSTFRTLSRAPT